jgi:hypothetical protein
MGSVRCDILWEKVREGRGEGREEERKKKGRSRVK